MTIPNDFDKTKGYTNLFLAFLKNYKCLDKFTQNLKVFRECDLNVYIKNYNSPDNLLNSGFMFNNTPEGYDYWHVLDNKWELILHTGFHYFTRGEKIADRKIDGIDG